MSLPPGFLDELRQRVTLGRVAGRKVTWDLRKSNQAKGDLWAPCPFHQEKTASFHVDDRKGFYYCFGCHAKGDAVSFVRETENVGFMEAVEILAREAGMTMPAQDPRSAEAASRGARLAEVMEMAVQHYRLGLSQKAAEGARLYLARRGLSEDAQRRWEIGWAGEDRHGLSRALLAKGATADLLGEAGLTGEGQGGTYDRFWGRIIFPIRDARGRAVALGGRSLDPNARAKYLNSPQTPLFDKGRSLFNHGGAREAAGKGAQLLVAEGYMDVIALAEAGFGAAVAPLGTAVTEEQLALLWRIHDEPVIALDGDAAGLRAAMRVIDLALPRLEAGKGLRFALLPGGQDPDDLIRAKGAGAMQAVIDDAQPMVRLLWRRETEGRSFDSPERKAALDKALREAIKAIRDPSIRRHYGEDLRQLRWELWGPRNRAAGGGRTPWRGEGAPPLPTDSARASALRVGTPADNIIWDLRHDAVQDDAQRDAVLAILISTPSLLPEFAHEIEAFEFADPPRQALCRALLDCADAPDPGASLLERMGSEPLAAFLNAGHVRIIPALRQPDDLAFARLSVLDALGQLSARSTHVSTLVEGMDDMGEAEDEVTTRRLGQAAAQVDVTRRKDADDKREVVLAPNGLALDRDERDRAEKLLGGIDFSRGGRGGRPGRGS